MRRNAASTKANICLAKNIFDLHLMWFWPDVTKSKCTKYKETYVSNVYADSVFPFSTMVL